MTGTLTREQAAKYLNLSLPSLDAYLHRAERPIPCVKCGRKYIIPVQALENWLEAESNRKEGD